MTATQDMDVLISREQLTGRVEELGKEISRDYADKPLTMVVLMTGGIFFAADLARAVTIPLWMDSISASSYHGHESSGELKIRSHLKLDVKGRHILLLDEVFDTGFTIKCLRKYFLERGALSVKTAVAVVKDVPRAEDITLPEYVGFNAPNRYLIGYGLDSHEEGRHIPFIGAV